MTTNRWRVRATRQAHPAIEKNLEKNLGESIERIEKRVASGQNFPHSAKVLSKLKAARRAL
jgi:hypothetical protein